MFWLSLAPFAIRWVGENYNAPWPIALYRLLLLFAGIAYFILTKGAHRASRRLVAFGNLDWRRSEGLASVIYVVAIPHAFVWPKAAYGCYIFVAGMWLLPDRRIEKPAK